MHSRDEHFMRSPECLNIFKVCTLNSFQLLLMEDISAKTVIYWLKFSIRQPHCQTYRGKFVSLAHHYVPPIRGMYAVCPHLHHAQACAVWFIHQSLYNSYVQIAVSIRQYLHRNDDVFEKGWFFLNDHPIVKSYDMDIPHDLNNIGGKQLIYATQC